LPAKSRHGGTWHPVASSRHRLRRWQLIRHLKWQKKLMFFCHLPIFNLWKKVSPLGAWVIWGDDIYKVVESFDPYAEKRRES